MSVDLPDDVWKLIFIKCKRYPIQFVCRRWRNLSNKKNTSHIKCMKYLELAKWACSNGCPLDSWTCALAAEYGHLEVLKRIFNDSSSKGIKCPWSASTCARAALGGHLEVLKWIRCPNGQIENACPLNEWTCYYAAMQGHLEILKWVLEDSNSRGIKCPWGEFTRSHAAAYERLDVLIWAKASGCP